MVSQATENFLENGDSAHVVADKEVNGVKSDSIKSDDETKKDKDKEEEKVKASEIGQSCEFKSIIEHASRNGGDPEIWERHIKRGSSDAYAKYALVERWVYEEEDDSKKTQKGPKKQLNIFSPHILAVLKKVVHYYPGQDLNFDSSIIVSHPYMMLQHHYEDIKAHREVLITENKEGVDHVDLLIDFLTTEGAEIRKQHEAGISSFQHLWLAFKPGSIAYEESHGHMRLYRIHTIGYKDHGPKNGMCMTVLVEFTTYDGKKAGLANSRIDIWDRKCFVNETEPIMAMPIFPLFIYGDHDQQETIKETCRKRGVEFLKIIGIQTFMYNGLFLYLRQPPWDYYNECSDYMGKWLPATTHGRVIVDPKTFNEEFRNTADNLFGYHDDDDEGEKEYKPQDSRVVRIGQHMEPELCPPFAYGFCLDTKQWGKFFVDNLSPPAWKQDALDSLVISEGRKRVIRSLVSSHFETPISGVLNSNADPRDEPSTKGAGLVFLLHGVPGCGKTLTAELVAEHTHRPLMNISTGELGSWEHRVAIELKRLLTYAAIWRAVVLIDEADVFLEARKIGTGATAGKDALKQNALVAVFLRQLEYFKGIIFLTSNRVGVFDPAIRSRIHLALQYDAPGSQIRRELWRKKVKDISESSTKSGNGAKDASVSAVDIDMDALLAEVDKIPMNGREISNTVNTACTLARDENAPLRVEHILTLVQLWHDFESNVGALSKGDEGHAAV